MRNIIFCVIEFSNNYIITCQFSFKFFVFRFRRLTVSAPRCLEKYENILTFHGLFEVFTNQNGHVIFFRGFRYILTLEPVLQLSVFVIVQKFLDISCIETESVVWKSLLDLVFNQNTTLYCFATHVLFKEPLKLVMVEPYERLFAGVVLDTLLDGFNTCTIVRLESEPHHV